MQYIIMVINFYTDFRFQPKKLQGKITNEAQRIFENILSDLDSVKREPKRWYPLSRQ